MVGSKQFEVFSNTNVSGTHTFRNLIVWQKALVLARTVYADTRRMPRDEIYGLTSQMRRAAVSVPSNIAEGSRRGTKKDFTQFLRIADGSLAELETQVLLVESLYAEIDLNATRRLILEVQKMLAVLIKRMSG